VHAIAQMLANTLYGRRFFPYYTWNILSGMDENGVGCVYSYDPVGNYERVRVNVTGSGEPLYAPQRPHSLNTPRHAQRVEAAQARAARGQPLSPAEGNV